MSKKSLIALVCCIVAFVAILLVATFFDLEINIAIGNAESVFGQFFNILGEFPSWLGIPVIFLILYQATSKANKFYKVLKPLFLIATLVGFYFFVDYLIDETVTALKWKWLYIGVGAIVLTGLSVLATNKVDKGIMEKLVVFAVLLAASIAVSQAIVTALKYIWARQRFRNLQVGNTPLGSDVGFTPWYKPTFGKHDPSELYSDSLGGKSDSGAYKSFPSGHTASASMLFCVIILPELFDKLKKYGIWFYAVPAVYTVLVAISRIVNRAHYLSDVLFGGTIGTASVFIFRAVVKKVWCKFNWVGAECFLKTPALDTVAAEPEAPAAAEPVSDAIEDDAAEEKAEQTEI